MWVQDLKNVIWGLLVALTKKEIVDSIVVQFSVSLGGSTLVVPSKVMMTCISTTASQQGTAAASCCGLLLTWWPLHRTHFRLLVKKSMVEFLSDDLESVENKCFFTEHGHLLVCKFSLHQTVRSTCGVRNLSILQARKDLSSILLTEGLSRGLRLNRCAKRERSSWE